MTAPTPFKSLQDLIESVKALRGEPGCSWHQQQTIATLAPFTQSEAYELTDAIEQQNPAEIKEELGDLLFHITLYAQHAEEQGLFNFEDIAKIISEQTGSDIFLFNDERINLDTESIVRPEVGRD